MDPLIIPPARGRLGSLLLFDLVLLFGSLSLLTQPEVRASSSASLGWVAVVFLAAGVPLLAWQALDRRPHLIVDERGVWYRPFGLDLIPWQAITGLSLRYVIGTAIICLALNHPEEWRAKLSPARRLAAGLNQALGFPAFNLNLSRLGVRAEPVFERMVQIGRAPARVVYKWQMIRPSPAASSSNSGEWRSPAWR